MLISSEGIAAAGGGLLRMLAQGMPIARTLEALASAVAQLHHSSRCAILLAEEQGLRIAAEQDLTSADKQLLKSLCSGAGTAALRTLSLQHCAVVKPLITYTAELIGAMVVFGCAKTCEDGKIARQLEDICAVATLAIEQRHLVEELSYRAHHDPLTHLWNRVWMEEEIARTLDCSVETGRATGLVMIGIDSFRMVNEVLGTQAGNQLLRLIAARLLDAVEPEFSLARGGGDEFLVLMPNLSSADRVTAFASQLLAWFDKPFEIETHELLIRASIGTAVAAPHECAAEDLQNRADIAMRSAKKEARGRACPFSPAMIVTPPERLVMEKHLRFALQKREFELYYQPQIHLPTGKLTGVEALLRWKHPSVGFISPATFIPIAEEIGIIEEIGDWVLGEAVRWLEFCHRGGLEEMRVSVNVSAIQFSRADFASSVSRLLKTAFIKPEHLELEITETAVMKDFQRGLRQLQLIRSLGISTALDDFGTGHSSLAYLQQLPISRLKIDRMFVKDITSQDDRPPLLSSIIQIGRALGCSVIAEGVESVEQALALAAMDCDEIQGFFFSKALPSSDLVKWANARTDAARSVEKPRS